MAFRVKNISSFSSHQKGLSGGPPPWLDALTPLPGMVDEVINFKPLHLEHHRPPFGGPPPWLDALTPHENTLLSL